MRTSPRPSPKGEGEDEKFTSPRISAKGEGEHKKFNSNIE